MVNKYNKESNQKAEKSKKKYCYTFDCYLQTFAVYNFDL